MKRDRSGLMPKTFRRTVDRRGAIEVGGGCLIEFLADVPVRVEVTAAKATPLRFLPPVSEDDADVLPLPAA